MLLVIIIHYNYIKKFFYIPLLCNLDFSYKMKERMKKIAESSSALPTTPATLQHEQQQQ